MFQCSTNFLLGLVLFLSYLCLLDRPEQTVLLELLELTPFQKGCSVKECNQEITKLDSL